MRVAVGAFGFLLVGLGLAVAVDSGGVGRWYVALLARLGTGPGSIMPPRLRQAVNRRSVGFRLTAGTGLVLVGAAWVYLATQAA